MKRDSIFKTDKEHSRIDNLYKRLMLLSGGLSALLFIVSLVAAIEFPNLFKPVAWAMIGSAALFLIVRVFYNFRKSNTPGKRS